MTDRVAVEKLAGTSPLENQTSHMRDIEETGGRTHGQVFIDDRRVLHGHRPTGEIDDSAVMRGMPIVQRSAS